MPLDLSRIRALCFDVDGTLSDTDDQFVERLTRFLHPFRFLLSHQDAHTAARRLVMWSEGPANFLIGIPDTLGLDDEILALAEWFTRHRRQHKKFLLIPGIREMLTELKGHYPMSIVSARDEKSTRLFLEQFDLLSFFEVVVTALTAEHTKPYPDPIYYAAQAMNVDPSACLMIGDTLVDIRAGKSAGAQTVGVLCGFGEEDELSGQADLVLRSTAELSRVLLADRQA
jgi:HAD superfamily hydrolase (TIGR01549 family)